MDIPRKIIWENYKGLHSPSMFCISRTNNYSLANHNSLAIHLHLYLLIWKDSNLEPHLDFFQKKYRSNMLHFQMNNLKKNST